MMPSNQMHVVLLSGTGKGSRSGQPDGAVSGSSSSTGQAVAGHVMFRWVKKANSGPEKNGPSIPNRKMLAILSEIEDMPLSPNPMVGKSAVEYIREAREGAMFGYDCDE